MSKRIDSTGLGYTAYHTCLDFTNPQNGNGSPSTLPQEMKMSLFEDEIIYILAYIFVLHLFSSWNTPLISAGNTEILQNKSIKGFQISGNIFFRFLAFKFLGQKFRPGFLAVLFPFHITLCHGNLLLLECVFFLLAFILQITGLKL